MAHAVLLRQEEEENEIEENADHFRQLQILLRILRNTSDPFFFPNNKFISEFRLNKYLVKYLIEELKEVLPANRSNSIPVEIKVFATLSFLATGTYQRVSGSLFYLAMSQSSMSRILHEIIPLIYRHIAPKWIRFPNTDDEKRESAELFQQVMGVPNVFAAVDGTLINILTPSIEEHNYVDRRGNHSKNVQIVCNYSLQILSINARYGGSAHDSFIWRNSRVEEELREQFLQGSPFMILGDSGYPVQPWLLTPIRNAIQDTPEYHYTLAHSRARSCVERCIGVIKQRFRSISSDNVMRYSPSFVGLIISVIACLHNMCISEGLDNAIYLNVNDEEQNANNDIHEEIDIFNEEYIPNDNEHEIGTRRRQDIIETYF